MRKDKLTSDMKDFDSNEEKYTYFWLEELKRKGFIKKIVAQPESFDLSEPVVVEYYKQMKTKGKYVEEPILRGHIYTTDFYVEWDEDFVMTNSLVTMIYSDVKKKNGASLGILLAHEIDGRYFSYIEVKPNYDMKNMTRLAKINQKWVYEKHHLFVNIVIPEKLFNMTFTPLSYFVTDKSGKPRKIKYKNKITLDEYLKENGL
jgi:hypothetical protein